MPALGSRFGVWTLQSTRPTPRPRIMPATTVLPSTLGPQAGVGLFAAEDIQTGVRLGWYFGQLLTTLDENNPSLFLMAISKRPPWCSKVRWQAGDQDEVTRYIDVPSSVQRRNTRWNANLWAMNHGGKDANAIFYEDGECVTTRTVKNGEELFVDYGPTYYEPNAASAPLSVPTPCNETDRPTVRLSGEKIVEACE